MNLRRMRYLINRLPMARFRVEMAMAEATNRTAALSGMPGGGRRADLMEQRIERLELAKEQYRAIREELSTLREELRPGIAALPDPLAQRVMTLRYLEGRTAREIACMTNYSERHIFRTLANAEKFFENFGTHVS